MSSVLAALLRHQGFQVTGLHFKVDDATHAEAERVSKLLGIGLLVEDARDALAHFVVDHVVHSVFANRKPEPRSPRTSENSDRSPCREGQGTGLRQDRDGPLGACGVGSLDGPDSAYCAARI